MVNNHNCANIVHYGSGRCHMVARSEMAAEVHGLVYGFNHVYMALEMLKKLLSHEYHSRHSETVVLLPTL